MTNDRFIKYIEDCVSLIEIEEHAKKLMAVAEAAKKCFPRMIELGLDEEGDFDNLMVLIDSRECE